MIDPLTEAVDDGLTDFVKVLLDTGANPNIPNQVALFSSLCLLVALMLWELWSICIEVFLFANYK